MDFDTEIKDEQFVVEPLYNTHCIRINEQNHIIAGWSDAFKPATEDSIVLTTKGGYQFRLWPEGEENPNLFDMDMIPLYKWDGERVVKRTEEEVEADRAAMPKPPVVPTYEERLAAMESAMLTMAMAMAEE